MPTRNINLTEHFDQFVEELPGTERVRAAQHHCQAWPPGGKREQGPRYELTNRPGNDALAATFFRS